MIPKKLAPAKAGVADFSDRIMRMIDSDPPKLHTFRDSFGVAWVQKVPSLMSEPCRSGVRAD